MNKELLETYSVYFESATNHMPLIFSPYIFTVRKLDICCIWGAWYFDKMWYLLFWKCMMWDINVCHDIWTQLISRKELHIILWEIMAYISLVHSICNSTSSVHGTCSTKDRISICPGSSWEVLLSCSYPASNSCPTAWWRHSNTATTSGAGHTCLQHEEVVFCE
jgi:hypothetical protein